MKNRSEAAVSNIASLLLFVFAATIVFFFIQFIQCFAASSSLPHISRYPLVRVCIYGSSMQDDNSTVSARIALLDYDSTEFAVIERSWNGYSLSMEFLCTSFRGKTVCFPFRLYGTDETVPENVSIKRGTKLYHYYIENGLCLLFGSKNSLKIKKKLFKLSRYALISQFQPVSNFSKRQYLNFSNLRTGETYTIYTGFDGSLFIVHD